MKKLFLPFLLVFSLQIFSQSFQKTYDLGGDDYSNNVRVEHAIFICGTTNKVGAGGYDAMLMAFDSATGNFIWENQFGGPDAEAGRAMTPFGQGFLVAGSTKSFSPVNHKNDIVISYIKAQASGYQGSKLFGFDSTDETANDILNVGDTAIYIIGQTKANGDGNHTKMVIIKLDNSADPVWMKTYGFPFSNEVGLRLFSIPGFGMIGIGYSGSGGAGMNDAYIVNFDETTGAVSNQLLIGAAGDDDGRFFVVNNNHIIIGGNTGSTSGPGRQNIFLTAINPNDLSIAWSKTYGGDSATSLQSLQVDQVDGHLVVGGVTNKFGTGEAALLFKVDSADGSPKWANLIDGPKDDYLGGIQTMNDGTVIVTGYSNSSTANDVYLARTNTTGDLCNTTSAVALVVRDFTPTITGPTIADHRDSAVAFVVADTGFTATDYTVTTNDLCATTGVRTLSAKDNSINIYPNPTSGRLFIESTYAFSNIVKMKIYNTIGSEVYTKTIAAGTKDFNIDMSGNPKGMYIITFTDGTTITTAKVSLN
ncbi:MAG: lipoprotein [Bacteroidota bacterium]|nr:lipoprotein [Bacteroidota bacterium]